MNENETSRMREAYTQAYTRAHAQACAHIRAENGIEPTNRFLYLEHLIISDFARTGISTKTGTKDAAEAAIEALIETAIKTAVENAIEAMVGTKAGTKARAMIETAVVTKAGPGAWASIIALAQDEPELELWTNQKPLVRQESKTLQQICGNSITPIGTMPIGATNRITHSLCSECLGDAHETITLKWFLSIGGEADPAEAGSYRLLLGRPFKSRFYLTLYFQESDYDGGGTEMTATTSSIQYVQIDDDPSHSQYITSGAGVHSRGDIRLVMAIHGKKTCH